MENKKENLVDIPTGQFEGDEVKNKTPYIKVEDLTEYIHKIYIPVNDESPHTIAFFFKDLKTGKMCGGGMSNEAMKNLLNEKLGFITHKSND